jgi:hypothetical protein
MGGRDREDQPEVDGAGLMGGSALRLRISIPSVSSADQVSRRVTRLAAFLRRRCGGSLRISRQSGGPETKLIFQGVMRGRAAEPVRARPMGSDRARGGAVASLRSALRRVEGRGRPLDPEVRGRLEPVLRFNLARVRVHTGIYAAESARRLRARAFTIGADIYFGTGQFRPQSVTGLGLLSHELTHVRQQGVARQLRRYTRDGGDRWEREAQEVEQRLRLQLAAPGPRTRTRESDLRMAFASQPARAKTAPESAAYRAHTAATPAQRPGCEKEIDFALDAAPVADRVYRLLKQEARFARERGQLRLRR